MVDFQITLEQLGGVGKLLHLRNMTVHTLFFLTYIDRGCRVITLHALTIVRNYTRNCYTPVPGAGILCCQSYQYSATDEAINGKMK